MTIHNQRWTGKCPRCGERHENLHFEPLKKPVITDLKDKYTHWALCPKTGEPIILMDYTENWLVTEKNLVCG